MSLTYRELQRALKNFGDLCTVKRNAKKAILQAEYDRIMSLSPTEQVVETVPTPTSPKTRSKSKSSKFDWEGYATSRKDAVAILKATRTAGTDISVKLNAKNMALLDALKNMDTENSPAPKPSPTKVVPFPYGFKRDRNGKLVPRTSPKHTTPTRSVACNTSKDTTLTLKDLTLTQQHYENILPTGESCRLEDSNTPEARKARLDWALGRVNGITYQPWNITSTGKRTLNPHPTSRFVTV